MKNLLLMFLFTFFTANISFAEIIDGPANVRDKPNGKIKYSLLDSIAVEYIEQVNNWYKIGIFCLVDTCDLFVLTNNEYPDMILKKGVQIKDSLNKKIGHTLDSIRGWPYNRKPNTYGCLEMILEGYTHEQNIRPNSIVENALDSLLRSGKNTYEDFSKHIDQFNYYEWSLFLDSYILYESWFSDPSPGPRIILFFENNKLFAILYRLNMGEGLFTNVSSLPYGNKVGYLPGFKEDKISSFEDSLSYIIRNSD